MYEVRRVKYDLEDPWRIPDDVTTVPMVRAEDGTPGRLRTELSAYYDDERLYLLYRCEDDHLVATLREHDADLWTEDVIEAFLAPVELTRYFEIEVNPLGTTFDAVVESAEGKRESMRVDRAWTCEGMRALIRRVSEGSVVLVDTTIAIPFSALERETPVPGERWRANFFRVDRGPEEDEYTAWRPTGRTPADFHVPSRFGVLAFS